MEGIKGRSKGLKKRRRNSSSWLWLGPASLWFFLEDIERSFCETQEEHWVWNWKEEKPKFLMSKDTNNAGPFVSQKVADARGRKFSLLCWEEGEKTKDDVKWLN